MKVLMIGRPILFNAYGGDRVQIENTAKELRKLGVSIDVDTGVCKDYSPYDLVHVFQLDWHPECYEVVKKARNQGKLVVLSPIHHNISEVKRFDDEYPFDFRRLSKLLFKDQFKRDVLKDIYRAIFNPRKIPITLKEIFLGLRKMYKFVISASSVVLVQTQLEATDLQSAYNETFKWVKVSNGVGDVFLEKASADTSIGIHNYILCVGRIEPRKNRLNIINALKTLRDKTGKDLQLVFVGSKGKLKHYEYTNRFEKELASNHWIKHINYIPYENMPSIYADAKVCVSASWFETTGLTSLEALICGTNAVAAGKRAEEYLGDHASYCDPGDPNSISAAIWKEFQADRPELAFELKAQYTWANTAKQTLAVYTKLVEERYAR